jgi:uncharacterized cupredoxin-like copper-binding protein
MRTRLSVLALVLFCASLGACGGGAAATPTPIPPASAARATVPPSVATTVIPASTATVPAAATALPATIAPTRASTTAAIASTPPTIAAAAGAPGNMVNIELKDFAIAVDATTVRAGSVTIRVKNNGPSPHSFMVRIGADEKGIPVIDGGATAMMTLDLTPGTYTFRCTVPAHDLLGMKGTLTVQ